MRSMIRRACFILPRRIRPMKDIYTQKDENCREWKANNEKRSEPVKLSP